MKFRFTYLFTLPLVWLAASVAVADPAPVYTNIAPGVSYAHITQPEIPWSIHIVKFDYHRPELKLTSTIGRPTIFGLKNLTGQVKSVSPAMGHPIAGINGAFFHITEKDPYKGDPEGVQIMQGELISSPDSKTAFWLDGHGVPQTGMVKSKLKVTWPNKFSVPYGVNEQRAPDKAALLTPRLGASTRMTNGLELVLERKGTGPWLPLRAGQTYSARVREIRNSGDTPLSPDIMVLSIGPKLADKIPATKVGTILKISTDLSPSLTGDYMALSGGPILIDHGKPAVNVTETQTDHLHIRNPRTAIGWNDKEFFMFVVDGRKKDLSVGMTFGEMALKMIDLGCTEAMNLDGGGSTTMWVQGQVVNHPSDGRERSLGNALVLVGK